MPIDTTVGDLEGNRARIVDAAARAADAGAELAVFPELTLTGYPPRDLLDRPIFVADNQRALERLCRELPSGLPALVGFVDRDNGAVDHDKSALRNAVALICPAPTGRASSGCVATLHAHRSPRSASSNYPMVGCA